MAIANTPNQTREWVRKSERDLPPDQRTTFVLRSVPFAVRSQFGVLLGLAQDGSDGSNFLAKIPPQEVASLYVLALRCCLVGWRNYRDADGREVAFVGTTLTVNGVAIRGAASDETLELIDTETMAELGQDCLLSMVLTKRDVLG